MNENLDLTKILKDCPKGTKLYSIIFGEVEFYSIDNDYEYPIIIRTKKDKKTKSLSLEGKSLTYYDGECTLFPSKEQRDWSKFIAPWYKKERFDPKTLQPYDKVLVRNLDSDTWRCAFYSHLKGINESPFRYATSENAYWCCIPYNEETKHLVGTKNEAPEYYRYWEA